jgi:hypothetical protein
VDICLPYQVLHLRLLRRHQHLLQWYESPWLRASTRLNSKSSRMVTIWEIKAGLDLLCSLALLGWNII